MPLNRDEAEKLEFVYDTLNQIDGRKAGSLLYDRDLRKISVSLDILEGLLGD